MISALVGGCAIWVTPQAKPDFAVVCPHCDARGPWAHTKDLAVRFWNDGYPATRAAVRSNSAPTEIAWSKIFMGELRDRKFAELVI